MEKVISCFRTRPEAVICFPWAGGGSIHYARWGNVLSSSVEGKITFHTHLWSVIILHSVYIWITFFTDCWIYGEYIQNLDSIHHNVAFFSSICCQTSWKRGSSQRAMLSKHAADRGRGHQRFVASTEREAIRSFWPQVTSQQTNICITVWHLGSFCFLSEIKSVLFVLWLHPSPHLPPSPSCSFGAFTSFAVADALKKLHNLEPVHIFLSGASAPYVSVITHHIFFKLNEFVSKVLANNLRWEELIKNWLWLHPNKWHSFHKSASNEVKCRKNIYTFIPDDIIWVFCYAMNDSNESFTVNVLHLP